MSVCVCMFAHAYAHVRPLASLQALAVKLGLPFVETSAKTGDNVGVLFKSLARLIATTT